MLFSSQDQIPLCTNYQHTNKKKPAGGVAVQDVRKEGDDAKWVFLAGLSHHIAWHSLHHLRRGDILGKLLLRPPSSNIEICKKSMLESKDLTMASAVRPPSYSSGSELPGAKYLIVGYP